MGGGTGIRDGEWLYENAASRDKDFVVLEGATHNFAPCVECETRKGQFDNCVKNYFNYLKDWISRRFSGSRVGLRQRSSEGNRSDSERIILALAPECWFPGRPL